MSDSSGRCCAAVHVCVVVFMSARPSRCRGRMLRRKMDSYHRRKLKGRVQWEWDSSGRGSMGGWGWGRWKQDMVLFQMGKWQPQWEAPTILSLILVRTFLCLIFLNWFLWSVHHRAWFGSHTPRELVPHHTHTHVSTHTHASSLTPGTMAHYSSVTRAVNIRLKTTDPLNYCWLTLSVSLPLVFTHLRAQSESHWCKKRKKQLL